MTVNGSDKMTDNGLTGNKSPYDNNVKAEALALFRQGFSLRKTEERIKAKHGYGPGHTALAKWRQEADMRGLILEQSEALSAMAGDLIEEALGQVAEEEDKKKYLGILNAVRGTSVDKILATPVELGISPDHWVVQQIANMTREQKIDLLCRGKVREDQNRIRREHGLEPLLLPSPGEDPQREHL
jgi:hypothetical protein